MTQPPLRWFPPGTPVSSTIKLISSSSSSFHRLDMTLAVAEALKPNKPNQTKPKPTSISHSLDFNITQPTLQYHTTSVSIYHTTLHFNITPVADLEGVRGSQPPLESIYFSFVSIQLQLNSPPYPNPHSQCLPLIVNLPLAPGYTHPCTQPQLLYTAPTSISHILHFNMIQPRLQYDTASTSISQSLDFNMTASTSISQSLDFNITQLTPTRESPLQC